MGRSDAPLLYGTLETLILRTLEEGPRHGYGVARWLETATDERIRVDESSLYPALYRLEEKGLLESEWGTSELERRAKFYSLTRKGRDELARATREWAEFSEAVSRLLLDDA